MASTIVHVNWKSLGYTPAVLTADGALLTDVATWLISAKRDHWSTSTLYRRALSISCLCDYLEAHPNPQNDEDVLRGLWRSLHQGDECLAWKPRGYKTARQLLRGINQFADWLADNKAIEHPNPRQQYPLQWLGTLSALRKNSEMNFLSGIVPNEPLRFREGRRIEPDHAEFKRLFTPEAKPGPSFEFLEFEKLVHEERSHRNRMLWLLLGAGGLRISETLQMYPTDIGFDPSTGEAGIILCDPRHGPIQTISLEGKAVWIKREKYLADHYGLIPREFYARSHGLFSGWKGRCEHIGCRGLASPVAIELFVFFLEEFFAERGQCKSGEPALQYGECAKRFTGDDKFFHVLCNLAKVVKPPSFKRHDGQFRWREKRYKDTILGF